MPFLSLRTSILVFAVAVTAGCCSPCIAQAEGHAPNIALSSGEVRAAKALQTARSQGGPELYAFLKRMPKGADLHMHLSGAVYAETFVADAVRQGFCVIPIVAGAPATPYAQGAVRLVAPLPGKEPSCPTDAVPAAQALKNQQLYDAMIDSFSMRAFVPSPGISGHDQFFSTFSRFDVMSGNWGEWLDEVVTRAALQNEQYLEVMSTPPAKNAYAAASAVAWPVDIDETNYKTEFAKVRTALLSHGLKDDVAIDRRAFSDAEADRSVREGCNGHPSAQEQVKQETRSACHVHVHWLYQVLRGFPAPHVFAQTLLAFEVASADTDVVGLNYVMPEDGRISMQDYHLQMLMLDYLHGVYPGVHISLHAGELAPGMVPPQGLRFHIREAVDLGHAERIGHGVDVLYEDDSSALLQTMAQKHVMVEVNLTSNDVILGVKGQDSPLAAYRAARVPTALSTDDEGVSRIDLTHEFVRAVQEQGLSYADLKKMARTSLEHSFLPGSSLWSAPDEFAQRKGPCAGAITAANTPSPACAAFLQGSERATLQWELEHRFAQFEAHIH